jgi:ParB family chromosome partitioning protein
VAGERRWRATKRAGLPTIDCYFHEGDLTRPEVLEQQLIENCLREDLRPIEEARAFSMLMELNGWSAKHLAEAIRIEQSRISRALALLRLPADIQEHVDEGQLSARSAYELSKLQDDGSRRELAEEAASGRLTHEDVAKVVRQRRGKQKAKPRNTRQVFTTKNGYRVVVSANKKGTYREIEQALRFALEEVRHRIASNTKMS